MSINTSANQRLSSCHRSRKLTLGTVLAYTLLPRREKYQMAAITMMISRITHQ
jgi:hypothetical protein